ncbi:MAG: alkaline phosphatase D family protein [Asticcacaulis sp.]
MSFSRRQLLGGGLLMAAPALWPAGVAFAGTPDPFTLGVASGDPAADGFVLWTRLAPFPMGRSGEGLEARVPVRWEVASDNGFRHIVASGTAPADIRLGHSVHVEVEGLLPDRPYWYRFAALGYQSPAGRARTAPRRGAPLKQLKLGFASCAHYELGYFSAYRHMAEENFDLVLFLGDYIYEYSLGPDRADQVVRPYGLPEAYSLDDYRARYALHRLDKDLQALHASAPFIVTWDDHEVEDDYSAQWSKIKGVDSVDFNQRRTAAYQAYYEFMPLRRSAIPKDFAMQLYRTIRYGDLAEFYVLDGRQHRSIQPCLDNPRYGKGHVARDSCEDLHDPTRSMLGEVQEQWLYEGFRRAEATWNILAQNLLVAPLRASIPPTEAMWWTDTWDGYAAGRTRLLGAIEATRLSNPIVLTGDYHSFFTSELSLDPFDPAAKAVAVEFAGTSITSNGPSFDNISRVLPANPHIKFFDSRERGYVAIDLTPERLEARLQVISDRRDPQATVSTLKTHVVESGRAGLVAG